MPYKNYKKQKENSRINYYKNREKRIFYQREYDKKNKEIKNKYEREKRRGKRYNHKKLIQHYSQKHHFLLLKKRYGGCQICNSTDRLELHHTKYTKKIEDCMLLCQPCHKKLHRKI